MSQRDNGSQRTSCGAYAIFALCPTCCPSPILNIDQNTCSITVFDLCYAQAGLLPPGATSRNMRTKAIRGVFHFPFVSGDAALHLEVKSTVRCSTNTQ